MPRFLTALDVISVHHALCRREERPITPCINPNGLDAALARAQNAMLYGGGDLVDAAVTVAIGVAMAHPFADGNKRTATAAMYMFLRANGRKLTLEDAEQRELARLLTTYVAETGERDAMHNAFAAFVRDHSHDSPGGTSGEH